MPRARRDRGASSGISNSEWGRMAGGGERQMRMKRARSQRGQSVLEYALLLGVVIAVIVALQLYFKRGLQGRWKEASDQIGEQFTTNETYTIQTRQQSSREETTGTANEINANNWSQSKVLSALPGGISAGDIIGKLDGAETVYAGHETTRRDYVTPTGNRTLGAHGTFDSGRISQKKLFDDD